MASMFVAGDKVWEKAFTPLYLFANGEQGVWYDPSDLTTMFQDTAGTIPAAYGQPVGLILDKSGNGNHAAQATATARPTLGRMPVGGVRNLLTASETETQNALGTSVAGGQVLVGHGAIPVKEFTPTGGAGTTGPGKGYPNAVGVDVTLSVYVVPKGNRYIYLSTNSLGSQSNVGVKLRYDTQTQSMTTLFTGHTQAWSAKVQDLGSGLFRCVISIRPNSAVGIKVFSVFCSNELSNTGGSTEINFTDPPISSFSYGGWQAENLGDAALNPDPTAYQRVGASAYDVTEDGVPSQHYLYFDGVDDVLVSSVAVGGISEPFRAAVAMKGYNMSGTSEPRGGIAHFGSSVDYSHLGAAFYNGSTALLRTYLRRAVAGADPAHLTTGVHRTLTEQEGKLLPHVLTGGYVNGEAYVRIDDTARLTAPRDARPGIAGTFRLGDTALQQAIFGAIYVVGEGKPEDEENCYHYLADKLRAAT